MPAPDFGAMIFDISKAGARVHQLRFAREALEELVSDMHFFSAPKDWQELAETALAQVKAAQ